MNCEQCKEDRKCLDGLCIGCWKARAEKAEAAAAEMRRTLEMRGHNKCCFSYYHENECVCGFDHAMSSDAGKGWLSPQEAKMRQDAIDQGAKMIERLHAKLAIAVEALDRLKNFPCDRPVSSIAREALAKLKEEKA